MESSRRGGKQKCKNWKCGTLRCFLGRSDPLLSHWWYIGAPRLRLRSTVAVSTRDGSRLSPDFARDILFNSDCSFTGWDAWSKLARPDTVLQEPAEYGQRRRYRHRPSPLEFLPTELVYMILKNLSADKQAIIALGLTCEIMYEHVVQHIESDCKASIGPLCGVEIACIGNPICALPDTLSSYSLDHGDWGPFTGFHHLNEQADTIACVGAWQDALSAHDTARDGFTGSLSKKLSHALEGSSSSPDSEWALRNLTTKEYVLCRPGPHPSSPATATQSRVTHRRGEARRGYVLHDEKMSLRIDDVLLLRICWTSTNDAETDIDNMGICRGSWAGHCFDIIPLDGHCSRKIDDTWTDSTNEVVQQAIHVAMHLREPGHPVWSYSPAGSEKISAVIQCEPKATRSRGLRGLVAYLKVRG